MWAVSVRKGAGLGFGLSRGREVSLFQGFRL